MAEVRAVQADMDVEAEAEADTEPGAVMVGTEEAGRQRLAMFTEAEAEAVESQGEQVELEPQGVVLSEPREEDMELVAEAEAHRAIQDLVAVVADMGLHRSYQATWVPLDV